MQMSIRKGSKPKSVLVLETGTVFPTKTKAAQYFGVTVGEVNFLIDYGVSPKGTNVHLADMEDYTSSLPDSAALTPDSLENDAEPDKDATIHGLCKTIRERDEEIKQLKCKHVAETTHLRSKLESTQHRFEDAQRQLSTFHRYKDGCFLTEEEYGSLLEKLDSERSRADAAERSLAERKEDIRQAAALTGHLLSLTESHLEATYKLSSQLRNLFCKDEAVSARKAVEDVASQIPNALRMLENS